MSKFLDIFESSMPDSDIDATMKAKRDLQQFFAAKGIQSVAKTFRDEIVIHLDGSIVTIAIKAVQKIDNSAADIEEDGEDDLIAGLLNTNDDHLKRNPAALNAKKQLTNTIVKIAKNAVAAANTPI